MQEEFAPTQQSLLQFVFEALGIRYTILLPLVALICFFLVVVVVIRGKGGMAAVALLLLVHAPILIGIFAALDGLIASYTVIGMSMTTPHPAQVATGISTSLVAPVVAMLLTAPSYAVATLGACIRCLFSRDETITASNK
jgi:hypothetical protein